jgi:methionyl-tRNA formyltransferase
MKILFIGSVEFSYKFLEKLIEINSDIVGVCTKKKSSFNSDFVDLEPICNLNSIPCLHVNNINSKEGVEWIKGKKPDVIFCFGWSNLIRKEILLIPIIGVLGYHPAKLPENRGRHPLIWPFILGMTSSASTFFFMSEGADDGDILSQADFNIAYQDDARSLYDKVSILALSQLVEFIPKLESDNYLKISQNHSNSNTWRKRNNTDGAVDFRMTSRGIYNLVRGLTKPYVGAHIKHKGVNVSVWKVEEVENSQINIEPGKVLDVGVKSFTVKTIDNAIKVKDHDFKSLPIKGEYL